MNSNTIKVAHLKEMLDQVLSNLAESGIEKIEVNDDYYWLIEDASLYDAYKQSVPVMGQLSEDMEFLTKEKIDNFPASFVLAKLSHLLRYVSYKQEVKTV